MESGSKARRQSNSRSFRDHRCRVGLIGASSRGISAFVQPIMHDYANTHEVVGLYDINARRMRVLNEFINADIPSFTDLDPFFHDARPDLAIISTVDSTHADYVERALAEGLAVVCEKPLCTDENQCRRIRAARARNPHLPALTAHNARYSPAALKIKRLLDEGAIGRPRAILYQELLDRRHGASFFRRWHRQKKWSGGLLLHKASHDFDRMNWWLGSRPARLMASGALLAYGPSASPFRGERCHTCPHADKCPAYVELATTPLRRKLYVEDPEPGAYSPDLCIFDPAIDIEDHATVHYTYENGVQATYTLCACAAYEGKLISIEGTEGRLEYTHRLSTKPLDTSDAHGTETVTRDSMELFRFDQPPQALEIEEGKGGHGGADPAMLADLFRPGGPTVAPASLEDGIQAVLIGAAANRSMAEQRAIDVQSLA